MQCDKSIFLPYKKHPIYPNSDFVSWIVDYIIVYWAKWCNCESLTAQVKIKGLLRHRKVKIFIFGDRDNSGKNILLQFMFVYNLTLLSFILQSLICRSSAPDTIRGMVGWKDAQFTPRSWPSRTCFTTASACTIYSRIV